MSPRLLVDLLETTSPRVLDLWRTTDLDATGSRCRGRPQPVPVWLDCARDFTEYWVHRQQVEEATGRTGDEDTTALHTVLDTFLRAMPHTLAAQRPSDRSTVAWSSAAEGPGGARATGGGPMTSTGVPRPRS